MKETITKQLGRRIMNTIGGASVFFGLMVLILKRDLVSELFSSAAILCVASLTIGFGAGYIVGRIMELLFPTRVGKKIHKEPVETHKKQTPSLVKQQQKAPVQNTAMFDLLKELDDEDTVEENLVPDDIEQEEPTTEQKDESTLQEEESEDLESPAESKT